MMSLRSFILISKPLKSSLACVNHDQVRGLKIHKSDPPLNITMPESFKGRLPILPKIPQEMANEFVGKIPRGTREDYRMKGEEKVHTELMLGQFGIVSVHGGFIKSQTFETIRNYTGRKLKRGKSFAFYRVDPPYKVRFNVICDQGVRSCFVFDKYLFLLSNFLIKC